MDDLGRSIMDGRYEEQKCRLKKCGLSHIIYLVEEFGASNSVIPVSSCEQAVVNTQIVDGFQVKWTKDQKDTAVYLSLMTKYLQNKFNVSNISQNLV